MISHLSLQLASLWWMLSHLDVSAWMIQRSIKCNLAKSKLIINYCWLYPQSYHLPPTHRKCDPFPLCPTSVRGITCHGAQARNLGILPGLYSILIPHINLFDISFTFHIPLSSFLPFVQAFFSLGLLIYNFFSDWPLDLQFHFSADPCCEIQSVL